MAATYLTDSAVKGARVRSGRKELWDTSVPGLVLRVSFRHKVWFLVYRSPVERSASGVPCRRRANLGEFPETALGAARAKAMQLKEELRQGKDPLSQKRAAVTRGGTFEEVAADYLERRAKPKKVSWKAEENMLKSGRFAKWSKRPIGAVTSDDIREVVDEVARYSSAMASKYLGLIRQVLSWGVKNGDLRENVALLVSATAERCERERVLSKGEIASIWAAAEASRHPARHLVQLRLITAQRGNQIKRINANDIEKDGDDVWWNVPAKFMKSKRPHRVYLSPLARKVLTRRQPSQAGWYFPEFDPDSERLNDHSLLENLRTESGVVDWQFRDLRRTAATILARRRVTRFIVRRVLAHTDREVTAIYDRYSYDPEVKAAMLELQEGILEAIGEVITSEGFVAGQESSPASDR